MKRITNLLISFLPLLLLSLSTAFTLTPARALAASSTFTSIPSGYAYADYAVIPAGAGNTTYGPNIPVALNCTTAPSTNTLTNSAYNAPLGSLGNSGTGQSTITVNHTPTSETIEASSEVQNLSLFGGLIGASDIHTLVSSTAMPTGATSTNSSTFSGLLIAGIPIANNPAPNTTISLPGIGFVVLNEQSGPFNGPASTSISVNMLDVFITSSNVLGFAKGTRIIIAHADGANQIVSLTTTAYGLYASGLGGSTPTIGPIADAGISCEGGSATNGVSGLPSSTVGSTGSEVSSASGQITSSGTTATAQNTVSNMNLLGGLVSADKVTTSATASFQGTGSRSGSATFQNATIAGTVLPTNPAPNTRQNLQGIGYVVVNEQYGSNDSSGASETIISLDIYVTQANSLGLPIGARIVVSCATASVSD